MFRLFIILACATCGQATETFTDRDLTKVEIDRLWLQAAGNAFGPNVSATQIFAEVRQAKLGEVADKARAANFRNYGIAKWDSRFDCVAYGLAFSLELRGRLARELWHANRSVERPAAFLVGYVKDRPEGTPAAGSHCVVFVLTDAGPVFFDPQGDGLVTLSASEKKTLFFFIP
jgi:hypothetical protein